MTSWIRAQAPTKRKEPLERSLMFETSDAPFAAQALGLFYSSLYAKKEGQALYVNDATSFVKASNFPLFRSVYKAHPDLRYTDSKVLGSQLIRSDLPKFREFVEKLDLMSLHEQAADFFQIHEEAQKEVEAALNGASLQVMHRSSGPSMIRFNDAEYDLAVGISKEGAGAGRLRSLQKYARGLRELAKAEELTAPKVLVVSEDLSAAKDLLDYLDATWTVYTFSPTAVELGEVVSAKGRRAAFFQSFTRLVLLQKQPYLVGEADTALGQLLALTADAPDQGAIRLV